MSSRKPGGPPSGDPTEPNRALATEFTTDEIHAAGKNAGYEPKTATPIPEEPPSLPGAERTGIPTYSRAN